MFDQSFNPIKFNFEWTGPADPNNPHDIGWYKWDSKEAHKAARKARDEHYRELKARGFIVRKSSQSGCLVKVGGIGTGRPEIEAVVTCYYLHYTEV